MQTLTKDGLRILTDLAARHDVSQDTVLHLAQALLHSGGTQAQFNLPELGGMGQWMAGGMVMVGDMFNSGLKSRVDALCRDLSATLHGTTILFETAPAADTPWPADLGHPTSTGAQNDMRYAFFPAKQRLAILQGGTLTVYDTADHAITGFGQSQGTSQSLNLTTRHGPIPLSDLAMVRPASAE